MDLIALSIRRSVFAWILMSFLIVFGAIAAFRMGVSPLPDVDFPIVNVSISYEAFPMKELRRKSSKRI